MDELFTEIWGIQLGGIRPAQSWRNGSRTSFPDSIDDDNMPYETYPDDDFTELGP